jgi:hypothetical protein
VAILGHHPHLLAAGDVGNVTGDREAALQVAVVALAALQARVDQLVDAATDFDDGHLQRHAHLRRRQADTRRGTHRLGQVVDQAVEVPAEGIDRLALEPKPRVAEHEDGDHGHGGDYMEWRPRWSRRQS